MQVPLAWCNLWFDKRRLLVAVGGIAFAVLLMCMQLGFRAALLDSTVRLPRLLDGDLILTNRLRYNMMVRERFNHRRLIQAEALPEIVSAEPLYLQVSFWKHPRFGFQRPIRLLAFDPRVELFDSKFIQRYQRNLLDEKTILFDLESDPEVYGPPTQILYSELNGQGVNVVGGFHLGKDFANDGTALVSTQNFAAYYAFPDPRVGPLDLVDFGILKVKAGENLQHTKQRLAAVLPDDVMVLTKQEFIHKEQEFWEKTTPIGITFTIGVALGFTVGVIICYQVLFSGLAYYLPEFATLKAMGYQNSYFVYVVLQQSVILSLLGFLPGATISIGLYQILSQQTGLLLSFTSDRAAIVLILTTLMCIVSGCLALRKVLVADPAELFK